MTSPTMFVTAIVTAVDAQARATSCIASAYETAPAAAPPYASGTLTARSPSSPSPFKSSRGKRSCLSMSAAWGAITRVAKSRAVCWTSRWVSVSSRCMPFRARR